MPKNRIAVAILVILLMISMGATETARPHDMARPDLDPWFSSLHSKTGALCCDQREAEHAEWDAHNGHYRVKLGGGWVAVPDDHVVDGPNKAGHALVWTYMVDGEPAVRCFMPGEGI